MVNLYVFTIIPFIQDLPRLASTPRRDATNGKDGCKGHKKEPGLQGPLYCVIL